MKISISTILLLATLTATVVTPGIATNYYSDPMAGSMSNNGSYNAPWGSLASIFTANKTFVGGDTIFLRTGNHGYTIIKGENTSDVVIIPQPGESPVVSRLRISASATLTARHWKLYGLTVESEATGTNATPSYFLIEVYPYASYITISHCLVRSAANTDKWTRSDWRNRCNNGIFTRGRLEAHHLLENNLIENIAFGLVVASSNTVVRENIVHNFTNDGSRVLGSYILFEKNRITDLIKVMTTTENHDDILQAFTYNGPGQDTLKNDTLRYNLLICASDTTRAFRGPAQGMGCFDGPFLNWLVENNIVLTDHWHGISLYGAINCRVVNNTVLDPYPYTPLDSVDQNSTNIGPTWIMINQKSGGPGSSGNVVQNNLSSNDVIFAAASMGIGFNNQMVGTPANYATYFVDALNLARPDLFDLHLADNSPAIDAGLDAGAPVLDFDGLPRPQGAHVDLGAYEYAPLTGVGSFADSADPVVVFPNPFSDRLVVKPAVSVQAFTFCLFDACGRPVLIREAASDGLQLSLTGLAPGCYWWRLCGAVKVYGGVVVKQ